jgi:putative ABC transport system permease protein
LLAKTDALAHLTKLEGIDGDGFWIADEAAESMKIEPGDALYLEFESGVVRQIRIDGVYRALWKEPRAPYWRSLAHFIYERSEGSRGRSIAVPPPTFLIGEREQVAAVTPAGRGQLQLRWEWPLDTTSLTLDEAERLEDRLQGFQQHAEGLATRVRVEQECEGCPVFVAPEVSFSSLLPTAISAARERVSTLRGPADLLTVAGALVALVVVGGAAAFVLARRRVEAAVLFARGAGPSEIGVRAALETLVPVLLGAIAGLGLAAALTAVVGPGAVARSSFASAALATALVVPGALLLVGAISGLVFVLSRERHVRGSLFARVPWEIPVLAAAGVLLYHLRTRGAFAEGDGAEVARPSLSILLFPLLFTAGVAGLTARGLRRSFGGLRAVGAHFPAGPYLAVRRLAAAGRLAVLLATSTAVCLGTFIYAQAVARSLEETVEAKSLLFIGSDVAGRTDYDREISADFPLPSTKVTKLVERSRLGDRSVDVMAVDTATFASAAYFDDSWADEPLADVVRALRRVGERLPVAVAGDSSGASTLSVRGLDIPVEVVATTRAFPGMSLRRPLVVADRAVFERVVDGLDAPNPLTELGAENEIWVKGEPARAVRELESSTLRPFPILTAQEVRENPAVRSVTQTFSYLRALGLAAGLLALAGAVLYLQARHRNRVVSYALARRMRLSRRSHRLALGLELGTLLLVSFLIGTFLALLAARLVVVELDAPAPLPGGPLFRTPWLLVGAALVGLLAATAAGALLADRRARRAKVAEAIRAGE